DCLGLEKFRNRVISPFAAIAGAFVATKRRREVAWRIIDDNLPGAQPSCQLARCFEVSRLNVRRETVFGVVGYCDGFIDRVVPDDHEDWFENLLSRDGHVVMNMREDRGLDVVTSVHSTRSSWASGHESGALVHSTLDESLYPIPVCSGDYRSNLSV